MAPWQLWLHQTQIRWEFLPKVEISTLDNLGNLYAIKKYSMQMKYSMQYAPPRMLARHHQQAVGTPGRIIFGDLKSP